MDTKKEDYRPFMRDGKTPRCQDRVRLGFWNHQCSRSAKVGDRCRQHDPAAIEARQAKADARYRAERAVRKIELNGRVFLGALRKIAAGHNDARGLAQEAVDKFDDSKG